MKGNYKPHFRRSDIPYKDRLLFDKYKTVQEQRDEAAKIALQIGCVALNDTEGMGYQRLNRYAARVQELVKEYYEDTEVGEYHLMKRLEDLGFLVQDGHMFSVEDKDGKLVTGKKMLEGLENGK